MSTFTTIKTAIRDSSAMERILRALPGAVVERNPIIPIKTGGSAQFEFSVELTDAKASGGIFRTFVDRGLGYFLIFRADDGTLGIQINQDQAKHRIIESQVAASIGQYQQRIDAEERERTRLREAEIQRLQSKIDEEFRHFEKQRLQDAERMRQREKQREEAESALRTAQTESARVEANQLLARLDLEKKTALKIAESRFNKAAPVDLQIQQDLSGLLAQQYAREKISEQLEQIQQQYGVRLDGEETLDDGTIEITLKG
jgi:hypothetical protein